MLQVHIIIYVDDSINIYLCNTSKYPATFQLKFKNTYHRREDYFKQSIKHSLKQNGLVSNTGVACEMSGLRPGAGGGGEPSEGGGRRVIASDRSLMENWRWNTHQGSRK